MDAPCGRWRPCCESCYPSNAVTPSRSSLRLTSQGVWPRGSGTAVRAKPSWGNHVRAEEVQTTVTTVRDSPPAAHARDGVYRSGGQPRLQRRGDGPAGAPEGYEWAAPQISGSPTSAIANSAMVSVTVANSPTGGATDVNVPLPGTVEPGTPVDPDGPVTVSVPEQATLPNSVPAAGGFLALTRGVPGWLLLLLTVSTVAGMGGMLRRRWTNPS